MKKDKYLEDLFEDLYNFFKEKYSGKVWNFTDGRYTETCSFEELNLGIGFSKETLQLRVFCQPPNIEISDIPYSLRITYEDKMLRAAFHNYTIEFNPGDLIISKEPKTETEFMLEVIGKVNELFHSNKYQMKVAS